MDQKNPPHGKPQGVILRNEITYRDFTTDLSEAINSLILSSNARKKRRPEEQ